MMEEWIGISRLQIARELVMMSLQYIAVFIFILLDLWAGIRKAKKRGEYRSSTGLRKTIEKAVKYYNFMLVASVMDAMIMVAVATLELPLRHFPMITFLTMVIACFIEGKSIFEKNSQKEKAKVQEAINDLRAVMTDKDIMRLLGTLATLAGKTGAANVNEEYVGEEADIEDTL